MYQRCSGENIVCNVAAAVHDDIGRDLTQAVQQLYHLLLRKGRSAVLVLPFEQPQYRKAAVALKGDKVMGPFSGSAYTSSMSASCASMNCLAPSAVPR